jgi:hypothetical protein
MFGLIQFAENNQNRLQQGINLPKLAIRMTINNISLMTGINSRIDLRHFFFSKQFTIL